MAVLALPAVLFVPVLWSRRMVYGHDLWSVFAYTTRWVADELSAGRLPVWDPHVLAGYPLLAGVQAATFYPPAWAALVLGDAAFWNLVLCAHLVASGLFAELWLRRGLGLDRRAALAGAMVFALAGFPYMRLVAGHVHYVWAYPWAAAALWRLERWLARPSLKRAVLLAPTLTLMVLAGVPQLALAAALAVGARLLHFVLTGGVGRRERATVAAGAAAALAVGALAGAPQILPTLELAGQTQRLVDGAAGFVTTYSLPPEGLLTLLAPRFFGDAFGAPYWGRWFPWELCGYVGVVTLGLAALALSGAGRQRWLWAAVGGGALLVALGRYAPVFAVFEAVVPGAALFRGPGRYLYLFVVAAVPLAGMGVQRLVDADDGARRAAGRIGVSCLALAAALLVASLALWLGARGDAGWWRDLLTRANLTRLADGAHALPVTSAAFRERALSVACRSVAFAGGWSAAGGVVLLAFARRHLSGAVAATLAVAVVAAELLSFDARFVRGRDPRDLEWSPELRALLERELAGPYRLATVGDVDVEDAGRARTAGLDHAGGYEPMQLARYAELVNALRELPRATSLTIATPHEPHPVLDMLGVRVRLAPSSVASVEGARLAGRFGKRTALVSDRALPRAWIAPRALTIADPSRRLRFLAEGRWDPRSTVVLEQDLRDPPPAARGAGRVEIVSRAPGAYELLAESPDGGYLVLAESWYPGWTATVDGTPADVLRANHLVQAIALPPGRHMVRFVYRSAPLRAGFAVALGALCFPFAILLARRLRVRRRTDQRRDSLSNARA